MTDPFWPWFVAQVLPALDRDVVPEQPILEELDQRMHRLGLSWELGPALEGPGWAFAVSFSGDLDLVAPARALVEAAPLMARCQALLGKPPKGWDGTLDLPSRDGRARFRTATWACLVLPADKGFAVMVCPSGVDGVDEDVVALAARIAVQSELGEWVYAHQVRQVLVVDAPPDPRAGDWRPMAELRTFFPAG